MKTILGAVIVLLIGVILGQSLSVKSNVIAQGVNSNNQSLASHHQEMAFDLAPGEIRSIPFPKMDIPVRVEVSIASTDFLQSDGQSNQVVHYPPFVLTRTLSLDSNTRLVSSIGIQGQLGTQELPGYLLLVAGPGEYAGGQGTPEQITIGSVQNWPDNGLLSTTFRYKVSMWY